jgi:acetyl esterase/lipase
LLRLQCHKAGNAGRGRTRSQSVLAETAVRSTGQNHNARVLVRCRVRHEPKGVGRAEKGVIKIRLRALLHKAAIGMRAAAASGVLRTSPVTLMVVLLLHFCSPTVALNALAPRDGVTLTRDIAYADGPRRTLDVYAPRPAAPPAPVLVFFYGGGWTSGAKAMYRFVGAGLAARGVFVVIPDYRLYPDVRFPAFMDDAAAAVAWTHANAASFGGDPHRLFLMGHSAGGQIAALLALDARYLRSVGLSPERDVCGVIGLAAPYDFMPLDDAEATMIFGHAADWPHSEPITYVSTQVPPMLLLTGQGDRTIDPGSTSRFAARLRAAGASALDEVYPDVGHKTLIASFAGALAFLAPARAATLSFVQAHRACGE